MNTPMVGSGRHLRALLCGTAAAALVFGTACSNTDNGGTVGPPAKLTIAAGDLLNENVGGNIGPFVVRVTDSANVPLPNVTVNFVGSTGLTLTNASATTGQEGTAFTAGTFSLVSGQRTVTATVSGIATPVVFTATANPDVASKYVIAGGNNQSGPAGTLLSDPLSVSVSDQYNNPIPNVTVSWTAPRGTIGTPAGHTAANGRSTTEFTLPAATGTTIVSATATINNTNVTLTFTTTSN